MSISPAEYSSEVDGAGISAEAAESIRSKGLLTDPQPAKMKELLSKLDPVSDYADSAQYLRDAIQSVSDAIAPVWPLKDYVAVNPYLGLADRPFLSARKLLQSVSDCEVLMPLAYYKTKYNQGAFDESDVQGAVAELNSTGVGSHITVDDVLKSLEQSSDGIGENVETRHFHTIAEVADKFGKSGWKEMVTEEIGRHIASFYDNGLATWKNPHKDLPLFQAWRTVAQRDRKLQCLGLSGFCEFVKELPHTPEATIAYALNKLEVPEALWETFLLCQAHSIPGWSAWAKYQSNQTGGEDFAALLAIRLSYDLAIFEKTGFQVSWSSVAKAWKTDNLASHVDSDAMTRLVLLRATEKAFEDSLLGSLDATQSAYEPVTEQPLAQMVFCIDVRSERYRRNLEAVSADVQTFGFAGFFGIPMAFQGLGETSASPQLPALLSPQYTVHETVRGASEEELSQANAKRNFQRSFMNVWKQFQSSAVSCFSFVETTGLGFSWKLFSKSLYGKVKSHKFDGIAKCDHGKLGPDVQQLHKLGLSVEQQTDMAESILRGIGIIDNFAKLVVFCGHAASTENNPLQAGLDCGACCGHSGEPNARIAAMLLNQSEVRSQLAQREIEIPEETKFVAAVHDTTSDEVSYFDLDLLNSLQVASLEQLQGFSSEATGLCVLERMPHLDAASSDEVLKRSADWSEVRPEWGLAGNAAFIVAPRSVTKNADLNGRSFLHSYDYQNDSEFKVLEQIMTAPMVVAHWINMQYYASSVDNKHYGSGSKTIHNVVGKFGLFAGNGGDLTTGLPWQSVHDGNDFYHQPLRLLSVIAAPRDAVASIIQSHKVVEDLLINNWLNLVVLDNGKWYRFKADQTWDAIDIQKVEQMSVESA